MQTLGTLLRHLTDQLETAVEAAYVTAGLDYRPRYTPIVRVLQMLGPASIRAIAEHARISHSAASQTVAQMASRKLVMLKPGADARERIVSLTPAALAMLPKVEKQWAITNAAAAALDAELSTSLSNVLREAIVALEKRPMSERLAAHARKARR
jgi:DNA-binding MarR family transcriptional regulator